MDPRVLLVEDDASIREVTALGLTAGGFDVVTAKDGGAALARFRSDPPDLVVLDLMLPVLDGLTVCRTIRAESAVPIVMLTARTDAIDVVAGLQAGADDYVRKPFELPELLARLRVALRHHASSSAEPDHAAGVLRLGPLEIDEDAHEVRRNAAPAPGTDTEVPGAIRTPTEVPGTTPRLLASTEVPGATPRLLASTEVPGATPLPLTPTEFRLLEALARRPGRVLTREVLLDEVWGYDFLGDSRLVDVAIQRLRAKIEDDPAEPRLIQTVRGAGYRAAPATGTRRTSGP